MKFRIPFFLIGFGVLLAVLFALQLANEQLAISLAINQMHNGVFDFVCLYGTYLGDGWFIMIGALVIYYFNPRLALGILLSYAISAGFTQLLKLNLFADRHRPLWFLEQMIQIKYHLVEGAEKNYNFSFPSGHTTSAFAVFTFIALFYKTRRIQITCLALAVFTGFTRIYLLQHFLIDTTFGAIIGLLGAYFVNNVLLEKGNLDFILKLHRK